MLKDFIFLFDTKAANVNENKLFLICSESYVFHVLPFTR